MRRLIVTRGLPGSGKSTLLRELGLSDVTLSPDAIRLSISGPVLTADGSFQISQTNNGQTWKTLMTWLEARMARGETIVIDATHISPSDFAPYLALVQRHLYQVACLDFSDLPLEQVLLRNRSREEVRRLPEYVIRRLHEQLVPGLPDWVQRIPVGANRSCIAALEAFLSVSADLSDRSRIIHFGDIHGCATATRELIAKLGGIREDDHWIFVGDFFDRGLENAEVMRWLLEDILPRDNVTLLWGNHEDHLQRAVAGEPPVSSEFFDRTLPDFQAAGISTEELRLVCGRLQDMLVYHHGDASVLVTHAGLSTVPARPWLVSQHQCTHGTGSFSDNVDTQFTRNAPAGWFQVHGHRNSFGLDTRAAERSFNLEASVENCGQLRSVVLDASGWTPVAVKNQIFMPLRDRNDAKFRLMTPAWVESGTEADLVMDAGLLADMERHRNIRLNPSETLPHITSLNFTRRAFYDKDWNELTVKARGLFINSATREIVARSYDKFFNIDEMDSMSMASLQERLQFPVAGWLKENGFLGIIGYDRETDAVVVTSKSNLDGPFAMMAREILMAGLGTDGGPDLLRRTLRDYEGSIVMEVIDPIRDPHIIEYDRPHVVFLDFVRRSMKFERLPHNQLVRLGERLGVQVKKKSFALPNWRAFMAWYERTRCDSANAVEGYVVEDAAGFQFKVKTPYYVFWKTCRAIKDAMVRAREGGKTFQLSNGQHAVLDGPTMVGMRDTAAGFIRWCEQQDTETLKADLISVRRQFIAATPSAGVAAPELDRSIRM